MKYLLALLVFLNVTVASAHNNTLNSCERCLENCQKDKVTCTEIICSTDCKKTTTDQFVAFNEECFKYYKVKEGLINAVNMCRTHDIQK